MKTLRLKTLLILLTVALGTTVAWSSQSVPATWAAASHPTVTKGAKTESRDDAGGGERVPSIFSAEEIPAYLLTDPCDTTDY